MVRAVGLFMFCSHAMLNIYYHYYEVCIDSIEVKYPLQVTSPFLIMAREPRWLSAHTILSHYFLSVLVPSFV